MNPRLVLVVDDDDDIRESILEVLEEHDYAVVGARDGEEALALLRAGERPDAIVLDLMMPVMDGRQFRAVQRADPELAEIPIIVLSAHNDVARTAAEMVPCTFLKKPASLAEILAALARCIPATE